MKFVGHLDTMRYFQKAIRRAGLPVAFSGGYSPHMIMSFAAPLGVGTTSLGEYFDMELTEALSTDAIEQRLNAVMVDGVTVCSARQVEDGKASTAMALVAAADYFVCFRDGKEPLTSDWQQQITEFLAQKEITVTKKTKRSEKIIDIRPFIYKMHADGNGSIYAACFCQVPITPNRNWFLIPFSSWLDEETCSEFAYMIETTEKYMPDLGTDEKPSFVSLESLGDEVE